MVGFPRCGNVDLYHSFIKHQHYPNSLVQWDNLIQLMYVVELMIVIRIRIRFS